MIDKEPLEQINKIEIDGKEVLLSSYNLVFSEATLTEYLQKEGGYYNYFGAQLSEAENELKTNELDYDIAYALSFRSHKEKKASDKLADACAVSDDVVVAARKRMNKSKYKVLLLKHHLRSWDKNHENAQSVGHNLRKEMEKLNRDIHWGLHSTMNPGDEDEINRIVEPIE